MCYRAIINVNFLRFLCTRQKNDCTD